MPRAVYAIGVNYRGHAKEVGADVGPIPSVFTKFCSSITGPFDDVILPAGEGTPDWEAELAFVVGAGGRHIRSRDALQGLRGVMVAQDISERFVQMAAGRQFSLGKSFDSFCPCGPALVTLDELGHPEDLGITCRVNGELMQDSRTTDMIVGIADLVELLSSVLTLSTGGICLTGTPAGVGVVRKELQVKYKNSVVGVGWSMVNPAMTLGVYYFVFQIVLKNGIPGFAVYLLCGLLVWNLFSTALPSATGAVVGNAAIVKKVAFPREILALASVGASLQFFFYQAVVMVLALVVFRFVPSLSYLPLLAPALLALLMLTAALGIFLAAMNVYFRDIQHLLEVVMTAWFWATPIVYTYRNIADRLGSHAWVFRLNPITPIVLTFQRALYNRISPLSTTSKTAKHVVSLLPAHL